MKKAMIIVVLIFSLFSTTEIAYSYFSETNDLVLTEDNPLYQLEKTANDSMYSLIPKTAFLGENDTHEITHRYQIYIEEGLNYDSEVYELKMNDSLITNEELEEIFLFKIDYKEVKTVQIDEGIFTDGTTAKLIEVTIKISMNEPKDYDTYLMVAGKDLVYNFRLTVTNSVDDLTN